MMALGRATGQSQIQQPNDAGVDRSRMFDLECGLGDPAPSVNPEDVDEADGVGGGARRARARGS